MVGLGMLEGGILMRIPDYSNVHGVKDPNHWTLKASRVGKAHEDEFEKELEDATRKRKSELEKRRKKIPVQGQELGAMRLEVDHLLTEHDQKVKEGAGLDEETPSNGSRFSSWG